MQLFEQFVKERRYLKCILPSTEQRYKYSWKTLGPAPILPVTTSLPSAAGSAGARRSNRTVCNCILLPDFLHNSMGLTGLSILGASCYRPFNPHKAGQVVNPA